MNIARHIPFLKAVLFYTLTAFGGPQGHFGLMVKTFVKRRRILSEQELLDIIAFCQLLPGASSTQTITLIGYKRGGIPLAVMTLLIWILPASLIMAALSFLIHYIDRTALHKDLFKYLTPMAIGFLVYATWVSYKVSINHLITKVILVTTGLSTFLFFKTPWTFPIIILLAGIVTNFSDKRIPDQGERSLKIKWTNIWLFLLVFVVAGFLSETARKHNWENRKAYNLFENFYRFGSLVFGGGNVLVPMMYEQFVVREKTQYMTGEELLTGAGFVQSIPGPVFSVASYAGGMAMRGRGAWTQLSGCFIGTIAIFLPSALLVLFFYPIWHNLKKYTVIFRAMEGINAAVVGLMAASALYLSRDLSFTTLDQILVIVVTFCCLNFTKLPPPVLAVAAMLFGWLF